MVIGVIIFTVAQAPHDGPHARPCAKCWGPCFYDSAWISSVRSPVWTETSLNSVMICFFVLRLQHVAWQWDLNRADILTVQLSGSALTVFMDAPCRYCLSVCLQLSLTVGPLSLTAVPWYCFVYVSITVSTQQFMCVISLILCLPTFAGVDHQPIFCNGCNISHPITLNHSFHPNHIQLSASIQSLPLNTTLLLYCPSESLPSFSAPFPVQFAQQKSSEDGFWINTLLAALLPLPSLHQLYPFNQASLCYPIWSREVVINMPK